MICGINPACDSAKNYCIVGACIDKNTIYWGIAGIIGIMIMVKMTSKQ